MLIWKLSPAMATGCTTVVKTSEKTPLSALAVAKLIKEAGFPPGVINILSGYGPTAGEPLARHMDVDKVAFTGSSAIGHKIEIMAAESNLKRVTLELGGKSPMIVMPDADLDQALAAAHLGLFLNQGQACCASSRLYVHEDIYDEFVTKAGEQAKARQLLDPSDPKCDQGPQVDKIQFDKILGYIESGKQEGARLVTGGKRHGTKGYFIEPTVFADVKDDMKIAREEIFGPVMQILKFSDVNDAIKRANDTPYGLAAGVCSRDIGNVLKIAHALRAGTVWVNCYDVFDAAASFGGYKDSGHGREMGNAVLNHYTELKTVIIPTDK
jgi:aldehyde dehydrogenase (NAD+)